MPNFDDIVFNVSLDQSGQGAKSLKSLKEDFKNLQAELTKTTQGTKEYDAVLRRLGAVKDEMGDLRDTINALNPEGKVAAFSNVAGKLASGFQAATGAAALLGVESKDLEKTLLKVQAATAFAEGIRGLAGLKDAFMVLGAVIKANPIFALASVLAAVSAAVFALTRETSKLKHEIEQENDVINENIKVLDRQIELLEAQGGQERKIIDLKREKVALQIQEIENSIKLQKENLKEAEQLTFLESLLYSTGIAAKSVLEDRAERVATVNEGIKKSENEIADLKNHLAAEEIKTNNKLSQDAREKSDEKGKAKADAEAYWNEVSRQNDDDIAAAEAQRVADEFLAAEEQRALEAEAEAYWQQVSDEIDETSRQARKQKDLDDLAEHQTNLEQKANLEREFSQKAFQLALADNQANKALSDAFFAYKFSRAKKGSEEEEKLARRQFQINKALQIQTAVITGIQGVLNALTAQWAIPEPYATIGRVASAIAVGVGAAAQIAKIASVQFNAGGGSADVGGVPTSAAPTIQTQAPTVQQTTRLDEQGNNLSRTPVVKAQVVETEMTEKQERVDRLTEQSRFG